MWPIQLTVRHFIVYRAFLFSSVFIFFFFSFYSSSPPYVYKTPWWNRTSLPLCLPVPVCCSIMTIWQPVKGRKWGDLEEGEETSWKITVGNGICCIIHTFFFWVYIGIPFIMTWHLSGTRRRRNSRIVGQACQKWDTRGRCSKNENSFDAGVPPCPKIFYPNTLAILRRGCASETVDT